jgi:predicted DNA-binding transcriptional regulator AlpA
MPRTERANILPFSLPPRGLSRTEAAAYIGVSATLFDEMVKDGRMPRPKQVNARTVWDRRRVDLAFDALDEQDGGSAEGAEAARWSQVAV